VGLVANRFGRMVLVACGYNSRVPPPPPILLPHALSETAKSPVIHTVVPSSGTAGTLLYVSGTLLAGAYAAPTLVSIWLGGHVCSLFDVEGNYLSASLAVALPLTNTGAVICVVPNVPAGVYNITVAVAGLGVAIPSPTGSAGRSDTSAVLFQYEQVARVLSVSPVVASAGGGASLVITGRGFATNPSLNVVTLGGFLCNLTHVAADELRCTFPDLSQLDLDRTCPAREEGWLTYRPSAGVGSILPGSRGARLQTWNDDPPVEDDDPASVDPGVVPPFVDVDRYAKAAIYHTSMLEAVRAALFVQSGGCSCLRVPSGGGGTRCHRFALALPFALLVLDSPKGQTPT
jgi:hypothetical protein